LRSYFWPNYNFPRLVEPEDSLLLSQLPASSLCLEPDESCPDPYPPLHIHVSVCPCTLEIPSNLVLSGF